MRAILLAVLLVVSLVRPAAALPGAPGANDPMIVIGVVATLSGPGAMAGQDVVDGLNLALRHLGSRFANQEVRVVVGDDRGSPDTAIQVVRRMLERDRLDLVVTSVSSASLAAVLPALIGSKLFVLNLGAAAPALAAESCSMWFFDLATPPEAVHEAAGQYFTGERTRRLAVVGADAPATAEAVTALKRSFTGEVVAVLTPRAGATTFAPEIARLKELKPDAVYDVLTGGMGVQFVREFHTTGLRAEMPLVGTWTAFERPLLPAMAEAALEVVNLAPWSPDLDTPQNKRMVTDFELEMGRPATSWLAQAYDTALLMETALRLTGGRTADTDNLRAALRKAEFASVRGGMHFNLNHFPVVNIYQRKVGRDAKGRFTQELRGVVLKDWRDRQAGRCPMRWTEELVVQPVKPGTKPPVAVPPKPPVVVPPR